MNSGIHRPSEFVQFGRLLTYQSCNVLIGKYTQYDCDQCGTCDESCLECFEHWKAHNCWSEDEEEVEEVVVVE